MCFTFRMTADEDDAATIERWHRENTYTIRLWEALERAQQESA